MAHSGIVDQNIQPAEHRTHYKATPRDNRLALALAATALRRTSKARHVVSKSAPTT